ncbi:PLAC8-like protein 1 isoform X2 [Salarias fasciatus]|uniref:PLAC8-like protein 1 isoform X2 n=1 Tax=Salarias fasciatus TaxID=181472 RepID=UPI0011764BC4|nr:PLAC8-like protein 1 isoform X2 [Salarias fasciatus]XP_029944123.1 PLAC8-like protein 1 isoform X2 [Salarias fasciatus]
MSRRPIQTQPQSRGHEGGQWSTGLCCFALCCLPVFTCKVTSAVGACPCLPLLDCIGCVPPASLAMRASVRERYGIKGSVWSDCLYGCCCYPLSWLQISRELKRRAAAAAQASSSSSSSSSSVRYSALTSLQGAHLV